MPESATDTDVARAARQADAAGLIASICGERLAFLTSLKTWPVFGAGWSRRVAEVRADALAMAVQQSREAAAPNAARATAGAVLAGAGTAVVVAHQAGPEAPDGRIVVIIIAAAVIGLAGWLAWRRWRAAREV